MLVIKDKIMRHIILSGLLLMAAAHDPCPSDCQCSHDMTSINCQGRKLREIPTGIPLSVEKLYLDHNLFNVIRQGVICFPNLKRLYLQNNKIATIDSYAFNGSCLPHLIEIHLENNKMTNLQAYSFFDLPRINITFLTNNYIVDIHPEAFSNTTTVTLNLGENSFQKIPTLGDMKNLQNLYLQGNKIVNGTFPDSYQNLLALVAVGLSNNNIGNLDNKTFSSLSRCPIRKLELSRNSINVISRQAFLPLKKLQSLKLGTNPLTATSLEQGLNGLQGSPLLSLNIANLDLGGSLPSSTFQLLGRTHLRDLIMNNNKINDIPYRGFSDLGTLVTLDLSGSRILRINESAFVGLKGLETLFLNDNNLDRVPGNLPTSLQSLYLNGNQIDALKGDSFVGLHNLKKLYLGANKIVTLVESAFSDLDNLQILHLVENEIGTIPGNLFNSLGRLMSLELNKNNLKTFQKGSDPLSPMYSLKYLNLGENGCSWFPPHLFNSLKSLENLKLQNNDLGEFISQDNAGTILSGLNKLITIDLSLNSISTVPDAFFHDLSSVQSITLKRNVISGWRSHLFSNTRSLRKLDLSYNSISLVNSTSVKDFSSVQSLNMSHNPFSCSCDLRWFRDWINKTDIILENNATYTCNSPSKWKGKPLLSFGRTKINCLWFNLTFVIVIVSVSVVCITFIICIIYHKRWWLRLKLHRMKTRAVRDKPRNRQYQQINGEDKQYDAYISCAEDDWRWVVEHLLPDIDQGNLGQAFGGKFRLYFEERDAMVGQTIIANISDNMEASRKVLIILTKKYLNNKRYRFEIGLATDMRSQGVIDDIIIVKVEQVPAGCVPKMLHRKLERGEFLEWENQRDAVQTFKEKLKQILEKDNADEAVEV